MDNKKTVLITVIVGVAVLGALVWWMSKTPQGVKYSQNSPTPTPTPVVDENADINNDLGNINLQTPDFNSIDQGIQGL